MSRSLCLWARRKPPSPATPPTAAAAAGHRRAPTPATPLPQLRPPTDPKWARGRARPLPRPGAPPVSPDSGQPRRPHGQGWDCKGPSLCRVFSVT
jgi:hypothetical protein